MTYEEAREYARCEAIDWQNDFDDHNYSWYDMWLWQMHFEELGEKYGLLEEFRENGIC